MIYIRIILLNKITLYLWSNCSLGEQSFRIVDYCNILLFIFFNL